MPPQPKNNNGPKAPDEAGLRLLLENNLTEEAQSLIDNHKLQYKIVCKDGKYLLEDSVVGAELWLKKFITVDAESLQMKDDALKLSKIDDEVLIHGETGTGKELIARSLIGDRQGGFYRVNCAAMPSNLIESELFGHSIGAFTDAKKSKKGLFEVAKDGVLFLDEIGDLPIDTQAKVLNALQPVDGKRYIRPVGSNDEIEINCRVVCATHRNLEEMIEQKLFRMDLYARISTFVLEIKPLRSRKCDVIPIVKELGFILKKESKAAEFLDVYLDDIMNDKLSLRLNVRSLEQAVKRFSVLGKV